MNLDKWNLQDLAADYVFLGDKLIDFATPGTLGIVQNFNTWKTNSSTKNNYYPYVLIKETIDYKFNTLFFLEINSLDLPIEFIKQNPLAILVLTTKYDNKTQVFRYIRTLLDENQVENAVILKYTHELTDIEQFQLYTASDAGNQFIDGFGDGIWITGPQPNQIINSLSFGILQATRTRISKTEYISCPSCGRTLFDLQETTAKIRSKTAHLKGLKIGIMGCIVNGPGEMADADYGYVGTGPGKIHLYKEKEVVRKNVSEEEAVDALIELIKENGDWVEPIL